MKKNDIKIGEYYYDCADDSWADITWEVRLDEEAWFSCKTQTDAEIISRLVRIERMLKANKGVKI